MLMSQIKNVVLVHGGFVDGSGWRQVHELLTADGYRVSVVQNPTLSLAGDVLATLRVRRAQDGPCVLVGHSYGGVVITEAGTDDSVAALAYIAAFAPDAGESVNTLIADPPPGAPVPPILAPQDGFLFLDRDRFHASFAGDLPETEARFMADAQVPWGIDALGGTVTQPAWRTKPSWYLVAAEDRMIPPPAQRAMAERAGCTVSEVAASHSLYVSQPHATADLIKQAAASAGN
jgi:pimeloyl-ACP methyl ester carboxylesterase